MILNDMDTQNPLQRIKEMTAACIQCGTCTGSCPNAFAMDHTPRMLWRMIQAGQEDAVFNSKTFMLCSSCYTCTLRCPRGLELTRAMRLLTQMAGKRHPLRYKQSHAFYHEFLQSVRRHGRVDETEFMSCFFWSMKNPVLPLKYASLGLRLMQKKKVSIPGLPGHDPDNLDHIFKKVMEMEASS